MNQHQHNDDWYNHETRIVLLEKTVQNIENTLIEIKQSNIIIQQLLWSHFRWLMGIIFMIGGGLLGMMIKGFHLWPQ